MVLGEMTLIQVMLATVPGTPVKEIAHLPWDGEPSQSLITKASGNNPFE